MSCTRPKRAIPLAALCLCLLAFASCRSDSGGNGGGGDGDGGDSAIPATALDYVVFSWNDLGMHCLNPSYDKAVILPPYNTLWAQVVKRGDPPAIMTEGITVEYSILSNTYSYGKRDYGQFWDHAQKLFGVALERDRGLNLEDPGVHNGLSGLMVLKGSHFQANGIPVVPVNDALTWDPYQVAQITVRDAGGAVLLQTRATVPTSDEINCAKCHGNDALLNVLRKHDDEEGTRLAANRPVLCASCHGSPVLGQSGRGSAGLYLSQAIHRKHAEDGNAACYDCHPGRVTKCSRSIPHSADDGNCRACHGGLSEVASSVSSGRRTPWLQEPACATCHANVPEVATGASLYRNSFGHHGIACAACHGSPHAQLPSRAAADGYPAVQYQGKARPIGDCKTCHETTHGGGSEEFSEAHGSGRATACSVCHTAAPAGDTARWPHQFQFKKR